MIRIGIVAGEVSGDLLGAHLIKAWRAVDSNVEFIGITGPQMRAAGCLSIATIDSLSVMGAVEVIAKLPQILRARYQVLKEFKKNPPAIFIGIDSPDFNLPLEKKLRKTGIFTVQYNSPSVWAWRQGRVKSIARSTNLMLTLLPFEAKFYEKYQMPVTFVGHPLADEIPLIVDKQAARNQLNIPAGQTLVALLPGSRSGELQQLAEVFFKTAQWCLQQNPGLHFIVPVVNPERREQLKTIWQQTAPEIPLTIVNGQAQTVIAAADVALVASGTATLETCLLKTPMVVAYRFSAFTAWLAKRLVKVKNFSLPNLIAECTFIPEFFQENVTPENLGNALLQWLTDEAAVQAFQEQCMKIHQQLRLDASKRAVDAIRKFYRTNCGSTFSSNNLS